MRSLRENLKLRSSEVNTVSRGLRFSRNDLTVEVIKLLMIWHRNKNKAAKKPKCSAAEVISLHPIVPCKPIIGAMALRENNALQFSDN